MGRPRENGLAADQRLTIRLTPDLVEIIDGQRGGRSRAGYLRDLIRQVASAAAPDATEVPDRLVTGPVNPPHFTPVTLAADGESLRVHNDDGSVTTVPGPHRHKRGQVIRTTYEKGVKIKFYACANGCSETIRG